MSISVVLCVISTSIALGVIVISISVILCVISTVQCCVYTQRIVRTCS